jgi:hypothetical protein
MYVSEICFKKACGVLERTNVVYLTYCWIYHSFKPIRNKVKYLEDVDGNTTYLKWQREIPST